MAQPLVVVVKASYLSELRRLRYDNATNVRYNDLYTKLSDIFSLHDSFRLFYIDDEEDELTVANDYDLQEAIRYFEPQNNGRNITVRLSLKKDDQKPAQAQSEAAPHTSSDKTPSTTSSFTISTVISSSRQQQKPQEEAPTIQKVDEPIAQQAAQKVDEPTIEMKFSNMAPIPDESVHIPATPVEEEIPTPVQGRPLAFAYFAENNTPSSKSPSSGSKSPAQPPSQQSDELVTHNGVMCDCCFTIVRGMRWKCNECSDYDLCQACKSSDRHNHPSHHGFRAIPYPRGHIHFAQAQAHAYAQAQAQNRATNTVYHAAQCDFCESMIKGIRHKCINCPDFDLCDSCIALAATQHPDHTFMQVPKPGLLEIKMQNSHVHVGVRCDGCQKWIRGVRYKCVNCPDFDLCDNCEVSPLTKHDSTHVFLKVKRPLPRPMVSTQPLLPNLYSSDFSGYKGYFSPKVHQRCASRQPGHGSGSNRPAPTHAPYWVHPASRFQAPSASPATVSVAVATTATATSATTATSVTSNTAGIAAPTPSETPLPIIPEPIPAAILVESKPEAKAEVKATSLEYILMDTNVTEVTPVTTTATSPVAQTESVSVSIARPESVASSGHLYASFVEDINIPDGTVMQPQARFLKIWKMLNDGDDEWPQGTELQFCGGDHMFPDHELPTFNIPVVQPTKTVFVTADLQAPAECGHYVSYWRLVAPDGSRFGHRVWCDIVVEQEDVVSSTSSSMIFPRINTQPSATPSVAAESVTNESFVSESAPGTPRTTTSDRPVLTDDPFQDPPSYASSLAYSDRTPAGSVRSLPNESDDESDISSQYSAVSSENNDYIVVERDDQESHRSPSIRSTTPPPVHSPVHSPAPSVHSVTSSSLQSALHETLRPSSRLILEEEDQEEDLYGTQSELRPLMEKSTTANLEEAVKNENIEEAVVDQPTQYEYATQTQTLRDMV
ncbi:hypothetical protein BC937DRAFT_93782 [Endogone sp. FLAS-F59071]|nr:hypothetical protein BC937DRAFT_93782 [Endogone sp. FLAS-F59071]|eukprot:RUS14462.1 hypothetical protein BC937DRAFT_93782 [Endogone sp. FLAS-F59071]